MLSPLQQHIHARALEAAGIYRRAEVKLILVLQEVDKSKLYKKLNCSSLFQYAVRELKLSEAVAYCFISVARKGREVPALMRAIEEQKISASKASRLVSSLTHENAAELIEFAAKHSSPQVDRELARRNPDASRPDRTKFLSENFVHIEGTVSLETFEKLKRAEALEAKKGKKGFAEILDAILDEYLKHKDPVQKAERVLTKKTSQAEAEKLGTKAANKLCHNRVNPSKRVRLKAEEKHQVFARDKGRCTHIDQQGNRCESDRWLHIHHIKPVSLGGGNEPENLTTLCSYHHDLVHQLALPIEGQVTWLRSPQFKYQIKKVIHTWAPN